MCTFGNKRYSQSIYFQKKSSQLCNIHLLFSDPIPAVELKLKVSGPSEVRFNEPAQFRCDSNREDIEFTMSLDKQKMKNGFTSGELILQPGQLEHGTNQFEIECFGIDENNDKVTISHIVNVLCKYRGLVRGWSGWSIDHPRILNMSIVKP